MKRRQFLKAAGVGPCRYRDRRAGDRAIDAGSEVAPDGELAEVARHAVRRLRGVVESRRRSHRQQIPDPDLRRRRNRSGLAGARRRIERHRRDSAHRVLLLFRQGSDLRLRHVGRRSDRTSASTRLVHPRRRRRRAQRVLQKVQCHDAALRAIPAARWAAGSARRSRPSTTSKASNSASAVSPDASSPNSAACRSCSARPTSIRRWKRARSTPPSGSAPMTTRSSASTRSRSTTTLPVGGRAARCSAPSSTSTSGTRCRRTTKPSCATRRPTPTTGCIAKYDQVNPPALRRLIANGAQLRAFSPRDHGSLLQGGQGVARRDRQDQRQLQEGLRLDGGIPGRGVSLVPRRGIQLQFVHDPHTWHERPERKSPGAKAAGLFYLRFRSGYFDGGPKSSGGGSSTCGSSIFTLLGSIFEAAPL